MTQSQTDFLSAGAANAEALESPVKKITKTAKTAALNVAGQAADQAKATAEAAKDNVADEVSGVASALRTAARKMRSGSPQERTIGQLAEGLADASEAIRDKDLGAMLSDANRVARRNPLMFLGGAAVIGFAATRFLKASHAEPESTETDSDRRTQTSATSQPRAKAQQPQKTSARMGVNS